MNNLTNSNYFLTWIGTGVKFQVFDVIMFSIQFWDIYSKAGLLLLVNLVMLMMTVVPWEENWIWKCQLIPKATSFFLSVFLFPFSQVNLSMLSFYLSRMILMMMICLFVGYRKNYLQSLHTPPYHFIFFQQLWNWEENQTYMKNYRLHVPCPIREKNICRRQWQDTNEKRRWKTLHTCIGGRLMYI